MKMFKLMIRMPSEKRFKPVSVRGRIAFTETEVLQLKENRRVMFPGAETVLVELKEMKPDSSFDPRNFGLKRL